MSTQDQPVEHASSPVLQTEEIVAEERAGMEKGIALCLSGGGYRAMLFHVGAILRLNEAGLLLRLKRISSVSGGSITAGVLGMNWRNLASSNGIVSNLQQQLVAPIRSIAARTIDRGSVIGGIFLPGTISERVANAYDSILFNGKTLQDLPDDAHGPRFVLNATSVQTGALVRFSRPYLADYKVGIIPNPKVRLADAVAASSAFPPVLSPFTLDIDPSDFDQTPGALKREPFTDEMVLTDGGVYDNLGIETVWKRYDSILVSDGGGKMSPEESPESDWVQHSIRILDIVDNQVRSLRKRQIIGAFANDADPHKGTYWGIRTNIADYQLGNDVLDCPPAKTLALAETPTRLHRMPEAAQNRLMNWGYAVCDAALRKHFKDELPPGFAKPADFPFAGGL